METENPALASKFEVTQTRGQFSELKGKLQRGKMDPHRLRGPVKRAQGAGVGLSEVSGKGTSVASSTLI